MAYPALSQPGRRPSPVGTFPPPALRTRRADFRHRALQWNHAARTRASRSRPADGSREPWHQARTLAPAGRCVGRPGSAAPSGTAVSVLSTRSTLSSMLPPATAPARAAAASRRRPLSEPALGEPVVRTGRSRRAAVGISDGGSRQQRLSHVAVAGGAAPARRRPGAERGPQVEQHRRLPEGGDQGQLREQGQKVLAS